MRPKSIITMAVVAGAAFGAVGCGGSSTSGTPASGAAAAPAVSSVVTLPVKNLTILVKTDAQKGKLGPDRKWHDAFLPADFGARAGQTVVVKVINYDTAAHSFNAPSLGVNKVIAAGKDKAPTTTTFTFTAPKTPGNYQWFCALPCDPWAMAHDGYMRGHVTVTA
jgi:plastocyanin